MNTNTNAEDLINWRQLSKILTGSHEIIRKNKISKPNQEAVKELKLLINYWISKHSKQ